MDELDDDDKAGTPPPFSHEDVSLQTVQEAKDEYQRIYNAYMRKDIVRDRARTCGYLLSSLLALFKLEIDGEVLRRMDVIERELAEMKVKP